MSKRFPSPSAVLGVVLGLVSVPVIAAPGPADPPSVPAVRADVPTQLPKHDFTCVDVSELIAYTPAFGPFAPTGDGIEVAVAADGTVAEVRAARGGTIPPGGYVLAGTGDGGDWLRAHAPLGAALALSEQAFVDGAALALGGALGVVNGGPRLLPAGDVDIPSFAEGFVYPENPEFYYRFAVRRNPRTIAGVRPDGHIFLVTVEGRRPGYSVGRASSKRPASSARSARPTASTSTAVVRPP